MVQSLGHLRGGIWRLSHPFIGGYRMAASVAGQRQIWLKRLVELPPDFETAECCRAPLLPLVSRDVCETGLMCLHCNETAVDPDGLPVASPAAWKKWADEYNEIHQVAHWDDRQRRAAGNYDQAIDDAAERAAKSLSVARAKLFPRLLDNYPVVVWEDHDECLGLRPEEVKPA